MRPTHLLMSALTLLFVCGCSQSPSSETPDAASSRDAVSTDAASTDAQGGDATWSDSGDTSASPSLVEHAAWEPVSSDADPFDDRPQEVTCPPDGYGTEEISGEEAFAVSTEHCDYLTVTQPSLVAVQAGDTINLRLWHFELTGEGEAHLALQVGDTLIWEQRVPIPADAGLIAESVTAPADLAAEQPVYFHVHNHGANEYSLIELSLAP